MDMIPHRSPFLLVDKIDDITPRKRAIGIKCVSINDPYIVAYTPERPMMPNSLIIEGLSQTASTLFFKDPEFSGQLPYYSDIQHAEFKKIVLPGDTIRFECTVTRIDATEITVLGRALVDGSIVAEATFIFAFASKPSRPQIHPTASVHHSASLGIGVSVGPYTSIGANVIIGDNTILEPNIVIEANTIIGEECHIYFGTVIGSKAQDIKSKNERSFVEIGDRSTIREYVTINRATGEGESTKVGDDCLLMTGVHVGHNCEIGNNVTIVNTTGISGHIIIEDNVIIGGMCGLHQFIRIGEGAMIGGYTRLTQDIPPFMLCEGNPGLVRNVNAVGLRRAGFSRDDIAEIKTIFKELFRSQKNFTQAMSTINDLALHSPPAQKILTFLNTKSKRGINIKRGE